MNEMKNTSTEGLQTDTEGGQAERTFTQDNIYEQILFSSKTLDDAMVPETGRVLVVAPVKLESYKTHTDPPGISGELVECGQFENCLQEICK